MWRRSVTLGGGMTIVNGRKDGRWSGGTGVKDPRRSHSSYSAVSSPLGLYWGGSGASTGGLWGAGRWACRGGGLGGREGGPDFHPPADKRAVHDGIAVRGGQGEPVRDG